MFVYVEVKEIIDNIPNQSENKQSIQTDLKSHSKSSSDDSSYGEDAVGIVVIAFPKLLSRIDFGSHFDSAATHVFCDESVNNDIQQEVEFQVVPDQHISEKKRICGNFKEYELRVMLKELVTVPVPERTKDNDTDAGDDLIEADIVPADSLYDLRIDVRI